MDWLAPVYKYMYIYEQVKTKNPGSAIAGGVGDMQMMDDDLGVSFPDWFNT